MKVCMLIRIPDYQLAEQLGLELDYSDETGDFRKTNFPSRHIYERVLPLIVGKYSNIHYHRGSPYSGQGRPTTDQTLGDLHQCKMFESYPCGLHSEVYLQGTSGMGRRNHGKTGIYWLVDLSQSLGCTCPPPYLRILLSLNA